MNAEEIKVELNHRTSLICTLNAPAHPDSLVIFVHGAGSSRYSPRNSHVASALGKKRVATLLCDLLTPDEEKNNEARFNVGLLSTRLIDVTKRVAQIPSLKDLPIGYFGASSGAATALAAAAGFGNFIRAIVCRGGRTDLARPWLKQVQAPTLFVTGDLDPEILQLNALDIDHLVCHKKLERVPGASHLFEEPGKLDELSELATSWFRTHLRKNRPLKKGNEIQGQA
jgi:putative phosphoribosyl transferase